MDACTQKEETDKERKGDKEKYGMRETKKGKGKSNKNKNEYKGRNERDK
jgi:hypothetical protein